MILNKESIEYFAAIQSLIENGKPIMRIAHDHADCLAAIAHSKAAANGSLEQGCLCGPEWHGLEDDFCICAIEDAIPLDFCPECDSNIIDHWGASAFGSDHLIFKLADGSRIIAQCCEGYQPIAI